jgi:hypothetical protein
MQIQRAESAHHFHMRFLDGVNVERPDGPARIRQVKTL